MTQTEDTAGADAEKLVKDWHNQRASIYTLTERITAAIQRERDRAAGIAIARCPHKELLNGCLSLYDPPVASCAAHDIADRIRRGEG